MNTDYYDFDEDFDDGVTVNKIHYKGYSIVIKQDTEPEDPREWENLGIMFCGHKRYKLGDIDVEKEFADEYPTSWSDIEKCIYKNYDVVIMKDLYLSDHGMQRISTGDFNDPWDSGMVGYIVATREGIRNWYGVKRITQKIKEQASDELEEEVEIYDNYLSGQVYGYEIEKNGEFISSSYGYYGEDGIKDAIERAKEEIDFMVKRELEAKQKKLKELIKHNVPLSKRESILGRNINIQYC